MNQKLYEIDHDREYYDEWTSYIVSPTNYYVAKHFHKLGRSTWGKESRTM